MSTQFVGWNLSESGTFMPFFENFQVILLQSLWTWHRMMTHTVVYSEWGCWSLYDLGFWWYILSNGMECSPCSEWFEIGASGGQTGWVYFQDSSGGSTGYYVGSLLCNVGDHFVLRMDDDNNLSIENAVFWREESVYESKSGGGECKWIWRESKYLNKNRNCLIALLVVCCLAT